MKKNLHIISRVLPDSIGEELELEPGDALLSINGQPVEDVFDYRYLMNDEFVTLLIRKKNGEEWELEVEKEYEDDLGVEFENSLMDEYRSCSNHCIFCFIDQMPPGMRETLYFKDDDSRLSFLQGNYVTLTNMSDYDLDRIIKFHLSPINVSFQTMNPKLRCKMLHNRFAGDALAKVDRLYKGDVTMNGQIVLCKGINDRDELEYSLEKLSEYAPVLQSVSIVPVGLSRYRKGLYPLESFDKEDARYLISQVERWQKIMVKKHGIHFVHASDEWYILAGYELPEEGRYDGYPQLENGVGMMRLLETEVKERLEQLEGDDREVNATVATGRLAAPYIGKMIKLVQKKFPNVQAEVYAVKNNFFGEKITVSGLITATDLMDQLAQRNLGEKVLIPCNMLRSGEDVFLDDLTVEDVRQALKTEVVVVDEPGADLVNCLIEAPDHKKIRRRQIYEQTGSSDSGQT